MRSVFPAGLLRLTKASRTRASRRRLKCSDQTHSHLCDAKGVTIPVGVSANPSEIYTAPKSWAERAFPKLLHYGRTPKGCHFAAWEQPQIFTDEVRASFKTLRT